MLNAKQVLITTQMACVVPRSAQGYVSDLQARDADAKWIDDRRERLKRHCPDSVERFKEASENS